MKKNEIFVKYGMVTEIAKMLGVTTRTVNKALRFETNGRKSIAARNLAIAKMKEYHHN